MKQLVWRVQPKEKRQVSSHSLLASHLFPTCVHSLLECLRFAWCILIAVPMLCPFHNMVCARTRLVVAMNTQALCPEVICIHDGWMVDDCAERV